MAIWCGTCVTNAFNPDQMGRSGPANSTKVHFEKQL